MFENAGRYILDLDNHHGGCLEDPEDVDIALHEAGEILDQSARTINPNTVDQTRELLEQGAGRRPRNVDQCATVSLAVSRALRDACKERR